MISFTVHVTDQAQRIRHLMDDGKYLREILSRGKLDRRKRRNSKQKLTLQQKMPVHVFILNKRKPYTSKINVAVTCSNVAKTFWSITVFYTVTCDEANQFIYTFLSNI